jgi:hypothetical protein
MADDVATPSSPLVALVEQEKFEEALLDVIVSQRPHKKEPPRRVVRTRVDCLAWDCQLSLNLHALAIYLEFVPSHGTTPERFEECQCEDDDVRLHYQTWVPGDGHYCWLRGPINPLPMEHRADYFTCTICRILDFLQL